jgi:hypothetical protein
MALVKADGTLLAKAPGGTVLETQAEADPKVKVLINVYEDTPYDHVNYPTQKKQLKFRAGQIISQAAWDAAFPAPTIDTVSPATGAAAGGTTVTITGTGFTVETTVTFGGTAATSIVELNDKQLTCVTPAKTAGAYNVVVTTAGGSATKTNGFTYA